MSDALLLDGELLPTIDAGLLKATAFGHFTSMQVRGSRVDGLDHHFDRLDRSTQEVFGEPLRPDRVRADLRAALAYAGSGDLSLRVNVFATDKLHLLTRVGPPVAPGSRPPRLFALQHERAVPHLKHTGTFDLTHYARVARHQGYDDAVFFTRSGKISEASIWNICFAHGREIVFPTAPALPGIRRELLRRGLETFVESRIPLDDLGTFDAAYLTNSIDRALPVASITAGNHTTTYRPHPDSAQVIANAYTSLAPQPI